MPLPMAIRGNYSVLGELTQSGFYDESQKREAAKPLNSTESSTNPKESTNLQTY